MLSLGAGANSNTFVGVRNENSNSQVNAASGSQYNLWLTGGTMFTGKLTDAGTAQLASPTASTAGANNLNGDLWRSQADTTVVNHIDTGIGLGNVRGRQDEWETDVPGTPGSLPVRMAVGTGRRHQRSTGLDTRGPAKYNESIQRHPTDDSRGKQPHRDQRSWQRRD